MDSYTDDIVKDEYNKGLSNERVAFVKAYLGSKTIAESSLTSGYGETKPDAYNKTADGRAKNRRVEIDCK